MKTFVVLNLMLLLGWSLFSCNREQSVDDYTVVQPDSPVPQGSRAFGINLSDSENGFDADYATLRGVGSELIELNIPWNYFESAPGVYQDPENLLSGLSFYASDSLEVILGLAVINTVRATLPDYLQGLAWDDPQMIQAFMDLMEWIMGELPLEAWPKAVAIGNEVDLILDDNSWPAYQNFMGQLTSQLRVRYPGVKWGVKTTVMNGLFGSSRDKITTLNQVTDVVMLNYYPQSSEFEVLEPELVHDHFQQIVEAFPGREIWMTEVGYQSGHRHCNSSQFKQAEFYHQLFAAWDDHQHDIDCIVVNWLHDQSKEVLKELEEEYGSDDKAFLEYLGTLGLRAHDGDVKAAWLQLEAELEARNW